MQKVILDSNFLFVPFQFQIDVLKELENLVGKFEPVVLSTTVEEMKKIADGKSEKTRRQALSALKIAERCTLIEVERDVGEMYDDVVLRKAKELACSVATNDRDLRKRLRRAGIPTIYLRQRKKLVLEGHI